jgi:signal transduction histidine kinase
MRNSISVLNKMFNTLLDISKLDSGFAPTNTTFSIAQLVNDLRFSFSDLLQRKKLIFVVSI